MLLLLERYFSGRRDLGIAHVFHNLVPTLREAGVDFEYMFADGPESDSEFEEAVLDGLTGKRQLWLSPAGTERFTPRLLSNVKRKGVHIVPCWWDAIDVWARARTYRIYQKHYWYKESLHRQKKLAAMASVIVSFDWHETSHPEKTLFFPSPQAGQVYFPTGRNGKTVDVSMTGHPAKGDRPAWRAAFPEMVAEGGSGESRMPLEDYADLLRSSKLSLNVPVFRNGFDQLNGRSFEIVWSRTALLQPIGRNIAQFLEPGKEFIALAGPHELAAKARYYLEHEAEREEIAENAWRRATTEYTAGRLFDAVSERLG